MLDTSFLGHSTSYWLELEKKAEKLDAKNLLEEIAGLRAKVSFYESRIRECSKFSTIKIGNTE